MRNLGEGRSLPDLYTVWLSPDILTWQASPEETSPVLSRLGKSSHDEWEHARILLNPPCDCCKDREIDRKDAILAIWRSIEFRIRLLEEVYFLVNIPGLIEKVPNAKKRSNKEAQLQVLEEVDLVRGEVLQAIRKIRNEVMHGPRDDDAVSPADYTPVVVPAREKCLLSHDLVWYFLRSTEHLARRKLASYYLSDDPMNNPDPLTIALAPPNWAVDVSNSSLREDLVSYEERRSWIPVYVGSLNKGEGYEHGYCCPGREEGTIDLMGFVDDEWSLDFAKKSFTAV